MDAHLRWDDTTGDSADPDPVGTEGLAQPSSDRGLSGSICPTSASLKPEQAIGEERQRCHRLRGFSRCP